MLFQTIFGIFLIAHGLVHSGLAAAPIPKDPNSKPGAFFTAPARSHLLVSLGSSPTGIRWTGIILVVLATLGFVLAGMGALGVPVLAAAWEGITIISAVISLILIGIFWHPWLIAGAVIDLAVILIAIFLS
jgi:hypothetical protein